MESTPGLGGSADRSPGSPPAPRARPGRPPRRPQVGPPPRGRARPPGPPPAGAEPLPLPFWRRPRFAGAATLAVLAVIVALCATLSVELRPSSPGCLAAGYAPAAAT